MKIEKIQQEDSGKKEWFEGLVNNAYVNGWTYSSCTDEMWNDYVERWNHFVDYVGSLQPNEVRVIKILIGEAPPFYRANVPKVSRSYFYDPQEIKYTPWFGALYRKFVSEGGNETEKKSKEIKLKELASKGILLIDLFPFPIIQSTEVRIEVTGEFSNWIETYFMCFLKALLDCLKQNLDEVEFQFGMAATKYAATQFLLGTNTRNVLKGTSLFESPIREPEFAQILKFHFDKEKIVNETLFLPINVQKKDGLFDTGKFNDYFEFLVLIVYSNDWIQFEGESVSKFVKQKMSVKGFLDELNEKLMERKLLPIYSADSVMISLEEGVFFNSK
jgi:hypothetical protein